MSSSATYVAGFLLYRYEVLLVCKKRPDWQAGLWNAVGGKVEEGETPEQAMVREFTEETQLKVDAHEWSCFCTEVGSGYTVHFYRATARSTDPRPLVPICNDVRELLGWRPSVGRQENVVGNLHWLVPMALDWRGMVAVVAARHDIRERPTW